MQCQPRSRAEDDVGKEAHKILGAARHKDHNVNVSLFKASWYGVPIPSTYDICSEASRHVGTRSGPNARIVGRGGST